MHQGGGWWLQGWDLCNAVALPRQLCPQCRNRECSGAFFPWPESAKLVMLMKRKMLSYQRDHEASLKLQQCCLTLWHTQGVWQFLCPDGWFPSCQWALIWAVRFSAMALPTSLLTQPWLMGGAFSKYGHKDTRWSQVSGLSRGSPHHQHLCWEPTPCHWAVPPGYGLF